MKIKIKGILTRAWAFTKTQTFAWVWIAMTIVIIGCGLAWFGFIANAKPALEVPMVTKHEPALETLLTEWIYNSKDSAGNYHPISRRTCHWIAMEALKTNKPLFIVAVATQESEFIPSATSKVGAKGLMQVMWKVWGPELIKNGICKEERDLYDVDTAIRAGNFVLNIYLKEHKGDTTKTLDAYLGKDNAWYKNKIQENLTQLYVYVATRMPEE